MIDFSAITAAIKNLTPRTIAGAAIASGFLAIAPIGWIERLRLTSFVGSYGVYIGVTFIISASLLIVHLICSPFLARWLTRHLGYRTNRQRLYNLATDEKSVLLRYIDGKTRTQTFRGNQGVITALTKSNVLYLAGLTDARGLEIHNIHYWAWAYLNKHPDILRCGVEARVGNKVEPQVGEPSANQTQQSDSPSIRTNDS